MVPPSRPDPLIQCSDDRRGSAQSAADHNNKPHAGQQRQSESYPAESRIKVVLVGSGRDIGYQEKQDEYGKLVDVIAEVQADKTHDPTAQAG